MSYISAANARHLGRSILDARRTQLRETAGRAASLVRASRELDELLALAVVVSMTFVATVAVRGVACLSRSRAQPAREAVSQNAEAEVVLG